MSVYFSSYVVKYMFFDLLLLSSLSLGPFLEVWKSRVVDEWIWFQQTSVDY